MARYSTTITSAAALAVDTAAAWLHASANQGAKLRRVTLGVVAGTGAPTSQQLSVGINRVTTAGTTPTAVTPGKLDPQTDAASCTAASAFATPPTVASTDLFRVAFNSQSGVDLPWELIEELVIEKGTANGLAFINRENALPSAHKLVVTFEHEE